MPYLVRLPHLALTPQGALFLLGTLAILVVGLYLIHGMLREGRIEDTKQAHPTAKQKGSRRAAGRRRRSTRPRSAFLSLGVKEPIRRPPESPAKTKEPRPGGQEPLQNLVEVVDAALTDLPQAQVIAAPAGNGATPQRRSARTVCRVPVIVLWNSQPGLRVRECAETEVVNAHGALLLIRTPLPSGKQVELLNLRSRETVSARTLPGGKAGDDTPRVGVELCLPTETFWGTPRHQQENGSGATPEKLPQPAGSQ